MIARALVLVTLVCAASPAVGDAHGDFGAVRSPSLAPAIDVHTTDGATVTLPAALRGHVTAVQLMFTTCTATCPIQGAIFSEAQKKLASDDNALRLLSVTIDPSHDTVATMKAWLTRYGASARWSGALPSIKDADVLLDFLRGRATGADRHTTQAYLFDRKARLVYRTESMPNAAALVALMKEIAAQH